MTATGSKGGHSGPNGAGPNGVASLRLEIERTRADLGATVEALAAKADVKARAHDAVAVAVADVKARAYETVDDAKLRARSSVARVTRSMREHPAPWAVGAMLIVFVAFVSPRRWRR